MVILSHSIADVKHFFGFSCVQWTHPAVGFKCVGATHPVAGSDCIRGIHLFAVSDCIQWIHLFAVSDCIRGIHLFAVSDCIQWTHPAVVFKLCLGGTLGCWFRLYPGDTQRGRLKISDGLKPDLMILVLHRSWLSPVCPLSTPVTAEITVSTGHTRLLVSNCIQWIHPAGDSKCVRGTHLAVGYKLCPGDTLSCWLQTVSGGHTQFVGFNCVGATHPVCWF